MSLESGVILCRLNHELFPDPGNPMARITLPFEGVGTVSSRCLHRALSCRCHLTPRRGVDAEWLQLWLPRPVANHLFPAHLDRADVDDADRRLLEHLRVQAETTALDAASATICRRTLTIIRWISCPW